ncbi:DnaJ protein, putative [Plasmodium berghei]|uniref:DnaJ protein, putative n=3 Tax=Plasmodium berghei TaxID=5821 RepID=A0A509AR96_PLABA|nr:DnaJ protein, putative [Plasmodium berghei ANKA]CXJ11116.1 DnaJ protein, putative [Plasmodium berghei]SCO62425.1 DnaJ protein, putative [Plasmodium berghei]SCO63983.1 DnaJ protein, putative [Plasmodium berghei]VUC58116.1 DnaJ protein, putative [Plasmodium berghei ANKA]|eukprot:XP_034423879.1 DnaJ protein, putative [Plasmodium berghei ANKA]
MENQTKESNLNSESDKHDEEKNENPASNDEGDNINDSQLDELFEDFLKDVESISSNQNIAKETNKLKKEDAEKEINRILSNKNSSPFEILGIHQNINIDIIKNRYRQLSILIHPDKCKLEKANEAFHILNTAYEDLKRDGIKEQYKSVYEVAKKNIVKKLNLKKKKNDINEYLNIEEEYEITKEIQQLINEECEVLLKKQKEKFEYAQKCKLANLKYVQEKEEEKLREELKKEEEQKLWAERRDERVNSWKSYKNENIKNEKEFHLYKNISKKKEERTEEEQEQIKKMSIKSNVENHTYKKRRKK